MRNEILVLDTCSVESWRACLENWTADGGSAIVLISTETHSRELELQMLFLGAAGVLTFADLPLQLPNAIHTVAQGHLWFKREVLDQYVRQTRPELRRCSSSYQKFTTREKQITDLLLKDLSNRMIAQRLEISERTIKFHVSNILRKLNVGSRKELREVPHIFKHSPVKAAGGCTGEEACSPDLPQQVLHPLKENLG